MKMLLVLFAFISTGAFAKDTGVRIKAGSNYKDYSNDELRRRVWQLERAVEKLQDQIFQLAVQNNGSNYNGNQYNQSNNNPWTCKLESFGKTHVSTGNTKASALAQVLKKCSDATNAIHCDEKDVSCDNE